MSDVFMLTRRQLNRIKPYFPVSHGIPRVGDVRVSAGSSLASGTACNGRMRQRPMARTRRCTTASCAGAEPGSSTRYSTSCHGSTGRKSA